MTGCVVGVDNLETIDFVGKTCVTPYVPKSQKNKMSNLIVKIDNMYFFRKIKWFSLFGEIFRWM
jgi:hypothetical protein